MEIENNVILVGSRKSELAKVQTNHVIATLKKLDLKFKNAKIVEMNTIGDTIQDKSLSKIGEKSLFTKSLEDALAKGDIQFAVHSLKDMPTTLPENMVIAAICKREDPRDAVVLSHKHTGKGLATLPAESIIGTSSVRRIAQLTRKYPHLKFTDVRGNLNTRFSKLDKGGLYDGLILAAAGVNRLEMHDRITQFLEAEDCMHAVGQGALAVECAADNTNMINLLSQLQDEETLICCLAERSLMKSLEGGCSIPLAANSSLKDGKVTLTGGVFSLDGSEALVETMSIYLPERQFKKAKTEKQVGEFTSIVSSVVPRAWMVEAEALGVSLAKRLLERGAKEVLDKIRQPSITTDELNHQNGVSPINGNQTINHEITVS